MPIKIKQIKFISLYRKFMENLNGNMPIFYFKTNIFIKKELVII
jgi:hypothetical protein